MGRPSRSPTKKSSRCVMETDVTRRKMLQGAAALAPLASIAHLDVSNAQSAPTASPEIKRTAMSHIGSSTSRVDGRAKVTGAAHYAAEFDAARIAYGSVVTATIAKGRIARIDTSDA